MMYTMEEAATLLENIHDPEARKKLRGFALELLEATRNDALDGLTDKQRAFLAEYLRSFDIHKAMDVSDISTAKAFKMIRGSHNGHPGEDTSCGEIVHNELARREEESVLKAEYVREYIYTVMESSVIDLLEVDDAGNLTVCIRKLQELPHEVKRLIESVEERMDRGRKVLKLNFVSKSAALAIAARYTLTQKVAVSTVPAMNYEEASQRVLVEADPVEKQIAEARNGSA